MIYLILGGGLGNQMFQYAFGRFLSLKTGQEIVFNTALYDNGINKDRAFSLGYFSIPNIVIGGVKKMLYNIIISNKEPILAGY